MNFSSRTFCIYLAVSHQQPSAGRINKIAPTSYAFIVRGADGDSQHWGYGGAREPKEMLAHGLYRAAEMALLEDENIGIYVVVQKPGFVQYLREFVPNWLRKTEKDPAFTKNNLQVWKRLHTIWELGNLEMRTPNEKESQILRTLRAHAKYTAVIALADLEHDPQKYSVAGVFKIDET